MRNINIIGLAVFAFAALGSVCAEGEDARAGTGGSQFILVGFAPWVGRELAVLDIGPAPVGGAGGGLHQ
jgi:hypothetical protein